MKEKTCRCRTSAYISYCEYPAENSFSHLEGFWVGHKEEDECGVKGIFGFESEVEAHLLFCVIFLERFFSLRVLVRLPPRRGRHSSEIGFPYTPALLNANSSGLSVGVFI